MALINRVVQMHKGQSAQGNYHSSAVKAWFWGSRGNLPSYLFIPLHSLLGSLSLLCFLSALKAPLEFLPGSLLQLQDRGREAGCFPVNHVRLPGVQQEEFCYWELQKLHTGLEMHEICTGVGDCVLSPVNKRLRNFLFLKIFQFWEDIRNHWLHEHPALLSAQVC